MAARALCATVCASALIAAASPGCVDDGVSAHVICVIPPDVSDEGCEFPPDGDACLLDGVLNLEATDRYEQVFRVESGLKARVREVPPQGETNRIQFSRAKVELRDPSGARYRFEGGPNPYYVVAKGYVTPEGVGIASATIITPSYARELTKLFADPAVSSALVIASITFKGNTDGDTSVSSSEFAWPVRIIRASVRASDTASTCTNPETVCGNLFGQDQFANVCRPE